MNTKERLELMGQIVTVRQKLVRQQRRIKSDARHNRRWWRGWERENVEPRAGWVVGFRSLQNGEYWPGRWDDPPTFVVESTVPCMMVTYWPTYNAFPVPLDAYELGGEPQYTEARYLRRTREFMREVMEDWPRDEQGRWVSQGAM